MKHPSSHSPAYGALFILISVPLVFSGQQEILAIAGMHDDYNFVLRSLSIDLNGSYLAPIKEILYPLYVRVSSLLGISLRNFEVISYGLGLFFLWKQLAILTNSRPTAWLTIIPLALLCHQHAVFNRSTYDALQLILMPLTVSVALYLYRIRGALPALVLSCLVVAAQVLTRPEGMLFVLPFFAVFVVLWWQSKRANVSGEGGRCYLARILLIFLSALLTQQVASAINWRYFGFWAPTIMKSSEFQGALASLMSIESAESDVHRYAPFPVSSMQQAYTVSPEFRKAKEFFDRNINGQGWSAAAIPGYRADDGSISGGHFQWALLDASAFVAGPKPEAMLSYLARVTADFNTAYRIGTLIKKPLVFTAFGPDFSIFERWFWLSLWRIGGELMGYGRPILPVMPVVLSTLQVEYDFDRLALRRTALLKSASWQVSGWVVDPALGLPKTISLDRLAMKHGVQLNVVQRPDVGKIILGLDAEQASLCLCGIEVSSPGPDSGSLMVDYDERTTAIPLNKLTVAKQRIGFDLGGIHVHIDHAKRPSRGAEHVHFEWVTKLSTAIQWVMKAAVIPAVLYFIVCLSFSRQLVSNESERSVAILLLAIGLAVIIPRWLLLSAIDSAMYPGDEPRYLAAAVFLVWLLTSYLAVCFLRSSSVWLISKLAIRKPLATGPNNDL